MMPSVRQSIASAAAISTTFVGVQCRSIGVSARANTDSIEITAPAQVPIGASWNVPHDFASFSLPAHFFAEYAGNSSSPNVFSRDILDLLYNKTGAHPFIRVGGTSTDRVWYNASQELSVIVAYDADTSASSASNGIATAVDVNDVWFEGFENFPGSHWSWQLNMGADYGQPGSLDNALQAAEIVMNKVKGNLESFEIGNEPDLFVWLDERPANYTPQDYVNEWNQYADAVSEKVLKNNSYGLDETRFFQAFTMTSDTAPWSGLDLWQEGIDEHNHVKSVSFHQYAAGNSPWVRLQNSYMNHTANRDNITAWLPEIDFAHNHDPFVPVVLGETNSNSANINMSQIEGVFGSALYLIDHLLLGMSMNITRYNLIQGVTFGYSAWVPVATGTRNPYVRAPLYAQIFAADVLGHNPEMQLINLQSLPWNLPAYAVYQAGTLAKYIVINFDEWNSTTAYPRPSRSVSLAVPQGVDTVRIERLTGDGASADQGIQWAGLSWNYTDGRLAQDGEYEAEVVKVQGGMATLSIASTEAVLVTLEGFY